MATISEPVSGGSRRQWVLDLRPPYPTRNAVGTLRQKVLEQLLARRPRVGVRLWTDEEVVRETRLSRSTVRRALDLLQQDGWIDRRAGAGTFVGRRIAELSGGTAEVVAANLGSAEQRERKRGQVVRLAVLVFKIGDLGGDWYTPRVLDGIDEVAERLGVSVELVGNREGDVDAISRRLASSRPDVLACLTNDPKLAMVVRDAQRLGMPCVVTGTPMMGLGLPTIVEDNEQATRLAVGHLARVGHRRIGLVIQRQVEPWVFRRHETFLDALRENKLESDESLVHWLPEKSPREDAGFVGEMEGFIRRRALTGVVSGSGLAMHGLDTLVRSGRLAVPERVSVVSFE
jgi:DNA-binding LacI/PurR family transcriptional regulator